VAIFIASKAEIETRPEISKGAHIMSDTSNDPVSPAFDSLVEALKTSAFKPGTTGTDLARIIGYIQAVGPLADNWSSGKPASGKEAGKRGRKPKVKGEGTETGAEAE